MVPCSSALRCAAVSMPRASPEAMTKPSSPSSLASWRVNFCPAAEPLRAPTMATMGKAAELGAALDVEQRRGRIDMGKRRRIARLADRDETRANAVGAGKFGLGLGFGAEPNVVGPAAAPRQHRERGNGRFGPAELVDERAEGRRSHILASDQPEPGNTLTAAEPWGGLSRR